MTVLVSVKINDGVVMAADSSSSFASGMIYNNAHKIVNLREGLPVGVMVTGAGGIGNESLDTLLKDLRQRLSGKDMVHADWELDPSNYTMQGIASRVREFLFEEKSRTHGAKIWTQVRLCGYSAGRPLAEVWDVVLMGPECAAPVCVQNEQEFGPRWDGESEALDRLILGLGTRFNEFVVKHGLPVEQAAKLRGKLFPDLYELLFVEAMPIRTPSTWRASWSKRRSGSSSIRLLAQRQWAVRSRSRPSPSMRVFNGFSDEFLRNGACKPAYA